MLNKKNRKRYLQLLCVLFLIIWTLLAVHPLYRSDWWLENILIFLAVPTILILHRKLPLSTLSYTLIFIFLVFHTIGAHYTYAEVPAGRMFSDWLGLERNYFDRFVHFLWGFLLTIPVFEVLRKKVSRKVRAIFLFACCIMGMVGAIYELLEWAAAVIVDPEAGAAFLGTQGDEWDAQKDMLANITGSVVSVVFLPLALKKSA